MDVAATGRRAMITRFAPSPTGRLHLGHALSALTVWDVADRLGGTALLRIEDTDSTRCRPHFTEQIYDDLSWLGLNWPTPCRVQSAHLPDYTASLADLGNRGLLYPCSCTRRDITEAGAGIGVEGAVYPGTCRHRAFDERAAGDAIRLNLMAAMPLLPDHLTITEWRDGAMSTRMYQTRALPYDFGDPVVQRKGTGDPAYLLACVHDDAVQGITHVVRGEDLLAQTPLHIALQHVLGLPPVIYHHHRLVADEDGRRLAKIYDSKSIDSYRRAGHTPADLSALFGLE